MAPFGLTIDHQRLRTARTRDQLQLDRLIGRSLGLVSGALDLVTVAGPQGGPPLFVRTMPLPPTDRIHAALPGESRVLVLVVNPATTQGEDASAALHQLGLTRAEARVATLTGTGLGALEIAERSGTSPHTVRTQIKAAMGKLGFKRQSELVNLVSRLTALNAGN